MFIKAELWEKLVGYISSTKKPESEIWVSSSTYSIPGHINITYTNVYGTETSIRASGYEFSVEKLRQRKQ